MGSVDYSDIGYALFFVLELCIVGSIFLALLVLSLTDKHYKKHKLLFYTILSITLCIAGIAALVFLTSNSPLLLGIYAFTTFIAVTPVIIAYWIHLCSKHKERDYWIIAIVIAMPIVGLLWLLGTY